MRVKCLAQEHTVPRPGLEPGPFDPESSALTTRPPRLLLLSWQVIVGYDDIEFRLFILFIKKMPKWHYE